MAEHTVCAQYFTTFDYKNVLFQIKYNLKQNKFYNFVYISNKQKNALIQKNLNSF